MNATKKLISKIREHPNFKTMIKGLDLQEFEGAVFLFESVESAHIRAEQKAYFKDVLAKLETGS